MVHLNYALAIERRIMIKGKYIPAAIAFMDNQGLSYKIFEVLPNLYLENLCPACLVPACCCPATIGGEAVMKVEKYTCLTEKIPHINIMYLKAYVCII